MKNFNPRFKWCVTRLIWQHAPAGWQFDELSMFHRDKKVLPIISELMLHRSLIMNLPLAGGPLSDIHRRVRQQDTIQRMAWCYTGIGVRDTHNFDCTFFTEKSSRLQLAGDFPKEHLHFDKRSTSTGCCEE